MRVGSIKVAEAIAERLIAHGCRTVFGVLGDANLRYLEHFANTAGGRYVGASDEGSAVSMADGLARGSSRIGVASVTHGPGLTNTLTALVEATRAHTSLVLITGDTPARPEVAQRVNIPGFVEPTGAGYERAATAADAEVALDRAFSRCGSERRPIVLDLPRDVLDASASDLRPPIVPSAMVATPSVRRTDLELAAAIVAGSRRPLVLAGRGAVLADSRPALATLAERIGAPLTTTLLAKDYFAGHHLDLGICGSIATPVTVDVTASADVVIAFGASLNQHTTRSFSTPHIVQVVLTPDAVRHGATGIVGDAAAVAQHLLLLLDELGVPARDRQADGLAERLARPLSYPSHSPLLDPRIVCQHLDRLLPMPRHVVTDAGRHLLAPWRHLHVAHPADLIPTSNFGSIGLGLSTAIGAAIARPEQPTVAIVGDGGLVPQIAVLGTAARLGLDLAVVVLNDGAYGAEYTALRRDGLDPAFSLLDLPDFAAVARSFGIPATTVRSLDDLEAARSLLTHQGPRLLDIRIDPDVELWV